MKINLKNDNLVYPYFVIGGTNKKEKIRSFPGVFRFSVDQLIRDAAEIKKLGLNKILLFGVPDSKNESGSAAYGKDNIVSSAVKLLRREFPEMVIMTDVCLCAYTTHGHCGVMAGRGPKIDNEKTVKILAQIALSHAEAGADWVSPSAMAKGQVAEIRKTLDRHCLKKTKVMGYSAKFASNFYGPFRNAADSAPALGDRRAYQLDCSDAGTALREIQDDIKEGADMVMVKPALAYLDIIARARVKTDLLLAAYNVSGEYAMVRNGSMAGLWDEKKMVIEILTAIRRAGADIIITYHAKDAVKWLKEAR